MTPQNKEPTLEEHEKDCGLCNPNGKEQTSDKIIIEKVVEMLHIKEKLISSLDYKDFEYALEKALSLKEQEVINNGLNLAQQNKDFSGYTTFTFTFNGVPIRFVTEKDAFYIKEQATQSERARILGLIRLKLICRIRGLDTDIANGYPFKLARQELLEFNRHLTDVKYIIADIECAKRRLTDKEILEFEELTSKIKGDKEK